MAENNDGKWDFNQILTFIGVIITLLAFIVGTIVALATPEIRQCIGLEDKPAPSLTPAAPAPTVPVPPPAKPSAVSKPPVIHKAKEPAVPYECTIGDNKSEFIKEANTNFSVKFHNIGGAETASVTIAPAGKEEITLPTVGSGSKEFVSSAGIFLVHVLNVDWNSRTVTIQVSRKSS